LRRHGLNPDHRAELAEWRRMAAEARARGSGGATAVSDYEQARTGPQDERWLAARGVLRQRMPAEEWEMWIAPVACPTMDDQGVIRLVGPDMYFTNWLLDKYLADIQAAMAEIGATSTILVTPGGARR
jgi:chromosomal replication initiator protein